MRNSPVNKSVRAKVVAGLMMMLPLAGALQGCTDLDESPTSTISPDTYYRTEQEIRGALAGAYSNLRIAQENYFNISQVSTDETVVPTRGTDWFDNGKWLELHRQTWSASSAITLDDVNGAYNGMFTGVARANIVLNALKPNSIPDQAAVEAELHALRAFYYYMLLDTFGNVPIVEDIELKPRANNTRAEVFAFVESELLAARPALPATRDAANQGRLTQGAVDAILASLYLNAEVFGGTVTPTGLQKGPAKWAEAVAASDRILNSGNYALATDWRSIFAPNNDQSREIIFSVRNTAAPDLGLTMINRAAHYNSYVSPGGWNGFSTLADTYNAFDAADQRRSIFLAGPQVSLETGAPINDRAGNRLVFVPEIRDVTAAAENEGIRVVKFPFDPAHAAQHMGNDYPIFRLGEIYLIKAEALNELGRTAEAIPLVNTLRARVFNPPKPLPATFTQATFRTQMLRERLFELNNEGKRRQDMIRMGVFTSPFQYKEQREPYRILFPIPTTQLQTNPLLVQNPGY
jgi:hypothetical protein